MDPGADCPEALQAAPQLHKAGLAPSLLGARPSSEDLAPRAPQREPVLGREGGGRFRSLAGELRLTSEAPYLRGEIQGEGEAEWMSDMSGQGESLLASL